jgi:hypothetical protein
METMTGGRHQQQHNPSSTANGGYTSSADLEGPYAGEPPTATAEWRRSGGTSLTTGRAAARACCGHGAGKEAEWVGKGGGRVRVDPGLGAPDSDAGPRICRRQHPPARTTSGAAAPQGWPRRRKPAKKGPPSPVLAGGTQFLPGGRPCSWRRQGSRAPEGGWSCGKGRGPPGRLLGDGPDGYVCSCCTDVCML